MMSTIRDTTDLRGGRGDCYDGLVTTSCETMSTSALPLPEDLDRQPDHGDRTSARATRIASRKWTASLLSIAILATVLFPIVQNWQETPQDDFPLSYYPMFSFEKSDRQRVTYLVVYDKASHRFLLPYWYAGTGGMNQVRRQITKIVDRGDASRLCRSVAARVAKSEDLPSGMKEVEIVTGSFQMTRFFAGDRTPLSESVRAHCSVPRG
jgi:hypothetical protein